MLLTKDRVQRLRPTSSTHVIQVIARIFPPVKIVVHDEEGKPLEGVKISLYRVAKDQGSPVLEINEISTANGLAVNRLLPYDTTIFPQELQMVGFSITVVGLTLNSKKASTLSSSHRRRTRLQSWSSIRISVPHQQPLTSCDSVSCRGAMVQAIQCLTHQSRWRSQLMERPKRRTKCIDEAHIAGESERL